MCTAHSTTSSVWAVGDGTYKGSLDMVRARLFWLLHACPAASALWWPVLSLMLAALPAQERKTLHTAPATPEPCRPCSGIRRIICWHASWVLVADVCAHVGRLQQVEVLSNVGVKVPFRLTVTGPDYLELDSSWNWDASLSGATINGIVSQARARACACTCPHVPAHARCLVLHLRACNSGHTRPALHLLSWTGGSTGQGPDGS